MATIRCFLQLYVVRIILKYEDLYCVGQDVKPCSLTHSLTGNTSVLTAMFKHEECVFCSIAAMLNGTLFSAEQLHIIERHLREAAEQASYCAIDVRVNKCLLC